MQLANRLKEPERFQVNLKHKKRNSKFSAVLPNNCYMLKPGSYAVIKQIYMESNTALCEIFKTQRPFFKTPCDSRILGTYVINLHEGEMKNLPVLAFTKKVICLPQDTTSAVVMSFNHLTNV